MQVAIIRHRIDNWKQVTEIYSIFNPYLWYRCITLEMLGVCYELHRIYDA